MRELIEAFDERLRGLFESKAAELIRYGEVEPTKAGVTNYLADIYRELAEKISH